jgi:hypothetical protein
LLAGKLIQAPKPRERIMPSEPSPFGGDGFFGVDAATAI